MRGVVVEHLVCCTEVLGLFPKRNKDPLDCGSHPLEGQGALNALPCFWIHFPDRLTDLMKSILKGLVPR